MMCAPVFIRRMQRGQHAPMASQRGVALLEVLIAFFILAIGLMGLAALQLKSLQFNQAAYQRSQATVAIYDILDRMRLNRDVAQAEGYKVSYGDTGGGSGNAKEDLEEWLAFLKNNLPDGEGEISCNSDDICTVKVRWTDRFSTATNAKEELTVASQM